MLHSLLKQTLTQFILLIILPALYFDNFVKAEGLTRCVTWNEYMLGSYFLNYFSNILSLSLKKRLVESRSPKCEKLTSILTRQWIPYRIPNQRFDHNQCKKTLLSDVMVFCGSELMYGMQLVLLL